MSLIKQPARPILVLTRDLTPAQLAQKRADFAASRAAKNLPAYKRVLSKAQIISLINTQETNAYHHALETYKAQEEQAYKARMAQARAKLAAKEQARAELLAAEAAKRLQKEKARVEKAKRKAEKRPIYDHLIPPRGKVITHSRDNIGYITFPVTTEGSIMIKEIEERIPDAYDGKYSFAVSMIDRNTGYIPNKAPRGRLNAKNITDAVFGNLNNRLYKGYDAVQFSIWREVKGARQPFELQDSISGNCVIDAIEEFYRLRYGRMDDKKSKQLKEIVAKHGLKHNPVTPPIIDEIARSLRHRFVVYDTAGHVWRDTGGKAGARIDIFAQRGHGTLHVPLVPATKPIYGDPAALTASIHQQKKLFVRLDETSGWPVITFQGVHLGNVIYKSFRPSSVTGNPLDDEIPEYFDCMDADQYKFRKWKRDNNLRALSGVYFDIFRNADTHLTTQQFERLDTMHHHLYDMNRAYPSFKTNPLYPKYKLIAGYVTLYDARGVDQRTILDKAGVSFVSSIVYHEPLVEKTGWIQAGQWYNNIRLFVLVSEGWATIEITQTCICRQPEDIEFPFEESKSYNNAFVGRLISGASSPDTRTEYHLCYGMQDVGQLMYEFERRSDCVSCYTLRGSVDDELMYSVADMIVDHDQPIGDREPVYVVAEMKVEDAHSQLHQIHGCILAYQQVTFMKAMVFASKHTQIIAYNTDGFHVRNRVPLQLSTQPGGFKHEFKPIKYQSSYSPMEARPFQVSWDISRVPVYADELPVVLITGPAGCGKSYKRIELTPGVESVVLCPTNGLVANTKLRTSAVVTTYHKYFGIWLKKDGTRGYHKHQMRENIIFDEITIAPGVDLQEIIEKCRSMRVCLDLIGDVRLVGKTWITDQMTPVNDSVSLNECLKELKFTHHEIISNVRRQNAEDAAWIDSLRGDPKIYDRIVDRFGISKWQDICTKDTTGIATRHKICTAFGYDMIERFDLEAVRARRVTTYKKNRQVVEPKGALSWQPIKKVWLHRQRFDQETPKGYSYEMAFFRTAHAVQGQSIDGPVVINVAKATDEFLYVAISRCRRLSDVIIIDALTPPVTMGVFQSKNPNPYVIDVDGSMPHPEPQLGHIPGDVRVPCSEEYHMPMTPTYHTMTEAQEVAHGLPGNKIHTYIITRDDPQISVMNPGFRVWESVEDLIANYPLDILHCIQEVIEPHRPQKISVDMSWYKHDEDVQAVMWEMQRILESELGAKNVVIERAYGSCMAFDDQAELRWMKYARIVVTSHYVDGLMQITNFTNMLYRSLPERIRSYCQKAQGLGRCPRMLFSSRDGYQLGLPTEYVDEHELDLIRDEFCVTNVFYDLMGELHNCVNHLQHDTLDKAFL